MAPMESALPRPRQVTVAGWMIIAGSAAVVLTVFQQIAGLHSIDTREAVERVLGQPPFDGLGMSVDEVLSLIRVLSMIAAACATATAILGWHVLQRSRSARVALSILALPLFVTGLGTGAILSTAVAVAVVLLWMQPARDWFDGRWRPAPPAAESRPAVRDAVPPPAGQQQPPPYAAWPPPQASWPPPPGPPAPVAPPQVAWAPPGPQAVRRPGAVVAAVVLTWLCSLLLGGLFVIGAVWLVATPDTLMDELTRQNPELVRDGTVTVDMVRATLVVMAAVVAAWVLVACVTAFFVLRGARWARVVLLVSAGAAGLGLLIGTVVNPVLVLPLLGAVAVFALLLRRDVGAWFASRR